MTRWSKPLFSTLLLALAACQTTASAYDVPARITNANDGSRAALQQVVNDALQSEILLAADALTSSSLLIIERNPPKTLQGRAATGRNTEAAVQFRLVVNESDCILIDTRDNSRHLLESTTCTAE